MVMDGVGVVSVTVTSPGSLVGKGLNMYVARLIIMISKVEHIMVP